MVEQKGKPMNDTIRACKLCTWCERFHPEGDPIWFECHYDSPGLSPVANRARWPIVFECDCCRHFRHNKPEPTAPSEQIIEMLDDVTDSVIAVGDMLKARLLRWIDEK